MGIEAIGEAVALRATAQAAANSRANYDAAMSWKESSDQFEARTEELQAQNEKLQYELDRFGAGIEGRKAEIAYLRQLLIDNVPALAGRIPELDAKAKNVRDKVYNEGMVKRGHKRQTKS